MATGWSSSSRTVSSGSSTSTVWVPTSIVSHRERSRWVSSRAARLETQRLDAVRGRAAAVEGGGELPGDEGTPTGDGEGPGPVDRLGLVDHLAADDLDARLAQPTGTADGDRVGVGLGVDDPAYAGSDQRLAARTGAAGVVARLEGDDGRGAAGRIARLGERGGLGVRGAGSAVEALGDRRTVRGEQHAADPRVGSEGHARGDGERQGALHRAALRLTDRHLRLRSVDADSGGRWTGHAVPSQGVRGAVRVHFSSGL